MLNNKINYYFKKNKKPSLEIPVNYSVEKEETFKPFEHLDKLTNRERMFYYIFQNEIQNNEEESFVKKQILKDAELIEQGAIKGAKLNFFKSDVTGKMGASKPLLDFLKQNGIA